MRTIRYLASVPNRQFHTIAIAALSICCVSSLSRSALAQWEAPSNLVPSVNNNLGETVYESPGDELFSVAEIFYTNNTQVPQTIWITMEFLDDGDNVIASGGESSPVPIAVGARDGVSGFTGLMVQGYYGHNIKVRITWGTNAIGQVGSTIIHTYTCPN